MENQNKNSSEEQSSGIDREAVSTAVIKRLPRYFRYLREVMRMGKTRISSSELSKMMNVTASQIRQDFNCFGGFGQQGYGYNVEYLYTNICDLLGVNRNYRAVVIGAGNLGKALVRSPMFEKRGVDVIAMFDVSEQVIGREIGGATVLDMKDIEKYIKEFKIDIAVLTLPKECTAEISAKLSGTGIKGIWNFTGKEIYLGEEVVVENVHIGDSLMTLCYEIARNDDDKKENGK